MDQELMELVGWAAVNILVPVVLPFLILLLPKLIRKTRRHAHGLVLRAVQDGQLFWVATALCAVGSYELYLYAQAEVTRRAGLTATAGIIIFSLLALVSIILVVLQALDIPEAQQVNTCGNEVEAGQVRPPFDKGVVVLSLALVLLASVMACAAHYLAATAAANAILEREKKWQNVVDCMHGSASSCHISGVKNE